MLRRGGQASVKDYALSFGIAFGASVPLTWAVRGLARRFGLVAKPRADRWHRRPTALFGGVAIFIAFVIAYLLRRPTWVQGDVLLVACGAGMFGLGLVDDFLRLKPYAKLVGQIVISTAFTMYGLRLQWLPSPVLDQALTIFWLVGITNAMNLLDNLDGLAGGVAAIAALFFVYVSHVSGNYGAGPLAAACAGALIGFLIFNFNPASIFMGDCGSLFIGFFLGAVTLVNNQTGMKRDVAAVLAVPVLLLLIPIVDTTLVTLTRRFHGRPVSQGGRDHTSHRLVALGLSERAAALTLWALAAASGGLAVLLFFLVFLGRVKVYEPVPTEAEGTGRATLPTLADFAYKRRVFEVLNDLLIIVLAYYAAFLLRFDGVLVPPFSYQFQASLPIVIAVQLAAFLSLGLYRGLWRYTSMSDLGTLLKAVGGAWVASVVVLTFVYRHEPYSRGVLIMNGALLVLGIAGSRVWFRLLRTHLVTLQAPAEAKRVLIYGAGDGGELLVRELLNNRSLGLVPVGFIDDDPQKHGRVIHGLRVLGSLGDLRDLAARPATAFDEVLVSTTLAPDRSAVLGELAQGTGIRTRRMRIALE
jgi:UDP-GlcNAc:undecaprenyl-phosphate/decaprenyl-phosphate GlcNAc-1-phosphate transferase